MCDFDVPRSKIENLIEEWIFNQRDRAILKRRFLDGLTYEELSEEFFLSTQRIKAIVKDGRTRINRRIDEM